MLAPVPETELFAACRTLFGPDISLSRDFLFYLRESGAKTAFRQRAKETHPDRYAGAEDFLQARQAETFREVKAAYDLIRIFLRHRQVSGGDFSGPSGTGRPAEKRDFYHGSLPRRPLEIGLFLYYRRVIPFSGLIAALAWQRRQRPQLGNVACRWGWLNAAAVHRILGDRSGRGRFGERAVNLGLLTPFQLQVLLHFQRLRQQRLGEFFVAQGLVAREEMERLAAALQVHNAEFPSGRQW